MWTTSNGSSKIKLISEFLNPGFISSSPISIRCICHRRNHSHRFWKSSWRIFEGNKKITKINIIWRYYLRFTLYVHTVPFLMLWNSNEDTVKTLLRLVTHINSKNHYITKLSTILVWKRRVEVIICRSDSILESLIGIWCIVDHHIWYISCLPQLITTNCQFY